MEEELADIPEFLVGYQSLPNFARSALVIGPLSFVLGFFLATNKYWFSIQVGPLSLTGISGADRGPMKKDRRLCKSFQLLIDNCFFQFVR